MGLFDRRPRDELTEYERLVVGEFARLGRHGEVVRDPDDPYNTHLVTDRGAFGFANLYAALRVASPRERARVARHHVSGIVRSLEEETPDLDDPATLAAVRARLMSADVLGLVPLDYARPVAPGLVEVLCLDLPTAVQVVAAPLLEGRDIPALVARGRENLRGEPFRRGELLPDVPLIEGPSMFVASQLLRPGFAAEVVGAAPRGWVFAVPDRHTLAWHVVAGPDSVVPISQLAQIMGTVDRDSRPGGLLSPWIYYTDGEIVQRISGQGDDGAWRIEADGPFLAAIDPT